MDVWSVLPRQASERVVNHNKANTREHGCCDTPAGQTTVKRATAVALAFFALECVSLAQSRSVLLPRFDGDPGGAILAGAATARIITALEWVPDLSPHWTSSGRATPLGLCHL